MAVNLNEAYKAVNELNAALGDDKRRELWEEKEDALTTLRCLQLTLPEFRTWLTSPAAEQAIEAGHLDRGTRDAWVRRLNDLLA